MSGTGRTSSSHTDLLTLALLLLLVLPLTAKASRFTPTMRSLSGDDGGDNDDDDDKEQASKKGLLGVMQSSISAISKLHTVVSKYQRDRHLVSDTRSQAVLTDCADLSSGSKDAVHDSLSILVKLLESRKGNATADHGSGGDDVDMDDLRTNLSAALTEITSCTDELDDELPEEAPEQMKKAAVHIRKQADKASELLSKALRLAASP